MLTLQRFLRLHTNSVSRLRFCLFEVKQKHSSLLPSTQMRFLLRKCLSWSFFFFLSPKLQFVVFTLTCIIFFHQCSHGVDWRKLQHMKFLQWRLSKWVGLGRALTDQRRTTRSSWSESHNACAGNWSNNEFSPSHASKILISELSWFDTCFKWVYKIITADIVLYADQDFSKVIRYSSIRVS